MAQNHIIGIGHYHAQYSRGTAVGRTFWRSGCWNSRSFHRRSCRFGHGNWHSKLSRRNCSFDAIARRQGVSKFKSFWYGQLSAIVEPIAAVLGAVAVTFFTRFYLMLWLLLQGL